MKAYLERSMTYSEYTSLIDRLIAEGKSTGPKQSESLYKYSLLNRQRMRRIEKTTELGVSLKAALRDNARPMIWLVLTEGWCGDAAQSVPVIERIASESENIEARYVLRDENPELMDAFLTNGARSIPKLIALDASDLSVIGTWGPRPAAGQAYFEELRGADVGKELLTEKMQRWYNQDKQRSIIEDFEGLLKTWGTACRAGTA